MKESQSPKKLEPTWCVHYCSPTKSNKCEAGIPFDSFQGVPFKEMPCFWKNRERCVNCHSQQWPSQEKLEEDERITSATVARVVATLPLLKEIKTAHKGKDWRGTRPCPVCDGELSISHAGCNGHCRVMCSKKDCVNFIE